MVVSWVLAESFFIARVDFRDVGEVGGGGGVGLSSMGITRVFLLVLRWWCRLW